MARTPDPDLRWHRTTLDGKVAVHGEAGTGPRPRPTSEPAAG